MKISCITNSSFCVPKTSVSAGTLSQSGFTNNNISAQPKKVDKSKITLNYEYQNVAKSKEGYTHNLISNILV
mgnify:CR=1 FL=1